MHMMRPRELNQATTSGQPFFCWRSVLEGVSGHPVGIEELACEPIFLMILVGVIDFVEHRGCSGFS